MRRQVVLELWTRLVCLASVAALLLVGLLCLAKIDGWLAYETAPEICAEIGARATIALGLAIVLAALTTCLTLPYILRRPALAAARQEKIIRLATLFALMACGSAIIGIIIRWSSVVGLLPLTDRASIHLWAFLAGLLLVGTLACYFLVERDEWTNRLSQSISGRMTRRSLLLAGVGSLLTGPSIGVDRRPSGPRLRPSNATPTTRPNVLLVTFDALSAEDMSCYGYRLPTTPNIDLLAQSSYLFPDYYAASTFTTPCIASMLTGCYPSSTHIYHLGGSLRGNVATLPNILRSHGYATAASVANPAAHPAYMGFGGDFDILPPGPGTDFATREVTRLFRSASLAADIDRGANFVPSMLEQLSPRTFGRVHSPFQPDASFQQAERILRDLPSPFFLWVHVLAPHGPYLPEPPYLRRFLPTDELRTQGEFADLLDRPGYGYSPGKQPLIDKGRLRYDEWIAQADGAFGQFMSTLKASGRLANTAVIVSSDHGESFQGGYLGHSGPRQLRPIIHVPLVVHLPGQTFTRKIAASVDQTLLAPTILGIAGLGQPDSMAGPSLQSVLRGAAVAANTSAFTQYFYTNSAFKPIRHGTVGVIDGRRQFVINLDSGAGALFDLAEAHEQRVDRSAAEPALAAALRRQIQRRFPEIFGRQADEA
jgi:arylsulfatase A-like enzyme